MTVVDQSALAIAFEAFGRAIKNEAEQRREDMRVVNGRLKAGDAARQQDRRDMFDRIDAFEARVVGVFERHVQKTEEKLQAHDDMLDDLAEAAAEKRGRGWLLRTAGRGVAWVAEHSGLVLFVGGVLAASVAPMAWEAMQDPPAPAAAEPERPARPVTVVIADVTAEPMALRDREGELR